MKTSQKMEILHTERIILRPWRDSDKENCYKYAKNEKIGKASGWKPHHSIEESLNIIRMVLKKDFTYAITLRRDEDAKKFKIEKDKVIGSIGIMIGIESQLKLKEDEAEIGFWIGEEFWNNGLITEAAKEVIRYAFEKLNLSKIWAGHAKSNRQSERVQKKCGFKFAYQIEDDNFYPAMDDKIKIVNVLDKVDYFKL